MQIVAMSREECSEFLKRVSIGRLACSLDNQPYIVPVAFSYEGDCIYIFSTRGRKIKWMRQNPKVCVQADDVGSRWNWDSVIVTGRYLELSGPQHAAQREHAKQLLSQHSAWWRNPLVQRRDQTSDLSIETVFFRIDIESMSGLRAVPQGEERNLKKAENAASK
jgi:uncharacterized protein